MGFSTDVFTAPGHPGFPQDSDLVENNNFHDNNFNTFLPPCAPGQKPGPPAPGQNDANPGGNCSDVVPTVPVPVGVGLWIAGGNANVIRNNRFYDNWRRGTMLFQVPDPFVCGDPNNQVANCDPAANYRPPRIGTASTTTRWARRPTAAPTRTESTSGGTRAASLSTRPSTPGTAGTTTPARTAPRPA